MERATPSDIITPRVSNGGRIRQEEPASFGRRSEKVDEFANLRRPPMTLSKAQREFHRKAGARCFNEAWEYLDKKRRSRDDNRCMLTLVHASRFHWGLVGQARERAVADWQVSRAYAAVHEPQLALLFARSSLELCEANHLSEFLCTAYEAMARAFAVADDSRSARKYLRKARAQLEASSADDEDRKIFLSQIRETEKLIRRA